MNSTTSANGLLLVDKPAGITSFDVIRQLRRQTAIRKIGHAGTLDPMATGLMLMLFGTATKQAQTFSKLDKSYRARVMLGATSTTGDREGELTRVSDHQPSSQELAAALAQFTGEITQTPSPYSAIKINGVRAYKLARAGQAVEMPSRQVTVHSLQLIKYEYPYVILETNVSSGTYIRSLAEDIGAALHVGAHLDELRRLTVGSYSVASAAALDVITEQTIRDHLIQI